MACPALRPGEAFGAGIAMPECKAAVCANKLRGSTSEPAPAQKPIRNKSRRVSIRILVSVPGWRFRFRRGARLILGACGSPRMFRLDDFSSVAEICSRTSHAYGLRCPGDFVAVDAPCESGREWLGAFELDLERKLISIDRSRKRRISSQVLKRALHLRSILLQFQGALLCAQPARPGHLPFSPDICGFGGFSPAPASLGTTDRKRNGNDNQPNQCVQQKA